MTIRLLVFGGRNWDDQDRMDAALDAIQRKHGVSVLIEGGQVSRDRITGHLYGADWQAGTWAIRNRIPHLIFWARWVGEYGQFERSAGPERNERMLRLGRPQAALAMPGKKGTRDMLGRLQAAGVPVWQPYG